MFSAKPNAEVVGTDHEILVAKGAPAVLPCRVENKVASVTWSKGAQLDSAEIIVIYQDLKEGWVKEIYGDIEGLYDIESNFSLIINEVMIDHDGFFFCEVLDVASGRSIANQTYVKVYGESVRNSDQRIINKPFDSTIVSFLIPRLNNLNSGESRHEHKSHTHPLNFQRNKYYCYFSILVKRLYYSVGLCLLPLNIWIRHIT